jgi:hypothetical protein
VVQPAVAHLEADLGILHEPHHLGRFLAIP